MYFTQRQLEGQEPLTNPVERHLLSKALVIYEHYKQNNLWYIDPSLTHQTFDDAFHYILNIHGVDLSNIPKGFNYKVYCLEGEYLVRIGFEFKPIIFHPNLIDNLGVLKGSVKKSTPTKYISANKWLIEACLMVGQRSRYIQLTQNMYPASSCKSPSIDCGKVVSFFKDKHKLKTQVHRSHDLKISSLKIM